MRTYANIVGVLYTTPSSIVLCLRVSSKSGTPQSTITIDISSALLPVWELYLGYSPYVGCNYYLDMNHGARIH